MALNISNFSTIKPEFLLSANNFFFHDLADDTFRSINNIRNNNWRRSFIREHQIHTEWHFVMFNTVDTVQWKITKQSANLLSVYSFPLTFVRSFVRSFLAFRSVDLPKIKWWKITTTPKLKRNNVCDNVFWIACWVCLLRNVKSDDSIRNTFLFRHLAAARHLWQMECIFLRPLFCLQATTKGQTTIMVRNLFYSFILH